GGAPVILKDFPIEKILVSSYAKESSEYELLMSVLDQKNLETRVPVPGEEYTLGEAVFTILGPVEVFDDSNNSSIVFRLDFGERSFLFAGDQEKKAEKALLKQVEANLQADVLKVGHHGKNDACGKKFLAAVDPEYAVISCGPDEGDIEPEEKLLERLYDSETTVLRTDEQGTIIVVCDKENLNWNKGME
ncbi:MAG: ComEC/Rec2 family competence protein, partial [Lachnospiraceae bacterium]